MGKVKRILKVAVQTYNVMQNSWLPIVFPSDDSHEPKAMMPPSHKMSN